jgi:hypothetical protein
MAARLNAPNTVQNAARIGGFSFRVADVVEELERVERDLGFPGAIRLYCSADLPDSAVRSDSSSSAIVLPVFGIT